ncbi:membrane-bound lytic murein transglycosylase MltF [Thiohalobacter sp. IOR34]|uniref:membrane-bound lytic murein transglycosylase MltF n=1 Tax=Thiohalobacter sp. IOR34 TaxID=3057176 RepID=UPI0025B1F8B6|nr:membrane-bound lytic murein transglycosylase MltF [Thiohalobacter sp. IOR34]WJW76286.1 membrane-bound lytic murein transglycosylase MltF [Thiohalobacter sp. IOR34]
MRYILPILLIYLSLLGCERQQETHLAQVLSAGELVVVTRNSPTTYYEGPQGPTGFEYDMVRLFADQLGVRLRIVIADSFADILPMVSRGEVDLAAAGLTITETRKSLVRFGPSYQKITPQLVYRQGTPRPADLNDLNGILEVVKGSSHEERLMALRTEYPNLSWKTNDELDSGELLGLIWEQVIDYTIADSNEVAISRRFFPELRVAFDISDPEPLGWAFAHEPDNSLFNAAREFFARIRQDGTLEQLLERHYGHVADFDYVGTRRYLRHIQQRLPRYIDLFKAAAERHGLDWRLLAAIGYQESHWDEHARSPTGVRGIMMLTLDTMRQLGLDSRLDPAQSIEGGARYFAMMKKKIPARIAEPDRTWLALAAYNIGFGHLEDARILTQRNGGDPDKWVDVKKYLPLLSQKKWYKQTRHGYARGREPVRYVENIRSYYDILVWYMERDQEPVLDSPLDLMSDFPSL